MPAPSEAPPPSAAVPGEERFELVMTLTLVLLLLHAPEFWYARSPVVILAVLGLAFRRLRGEPVLWFAMTAFFGATLWVNWHVLDNHKFLEAYWCLALFCALSLPAERRAAALATNARLLIALCMAFSVFWKLNSPSYRDGSFFEFTLLVDPRFAHLAAWFGNLSAEDLARNRMLEQTLAEGWLQGLNETAVRLASTRAVERLAFLMTWWTVAIEGLLAAVFLAPPRRTGQLRDVLLLVFAATTYLVAPVQGFGWLLMIMGIAQCRRRWAELLYVAAFLLIEVYTIPYADVVNSLLTAR